jgi:hypothetical protein
MTLLFFPTSYIEIMEIKLIQLQRGMELLREKQAPNLFSQQMFLLSFKGR